METEPVVVRNPDKSTFELHLGDRIVGRADYLEDDVRVVFTHTEVDPALNGQGLGSTLARGALDAVQADGKRIVPQCSFIAVYVRRHADDYAGIIDVS